MTDHKFKYRLDSRCRIITLGVVGGLTVVFVVLWFFSPGGYLSAWFSSISIALVCLASLSIPRSIHVTSDAVEISCTVEISHIPAAHIASARCIERSELSPLVPLFASPGFFGYFGYWLDVRKWEFVKVYASSWRGLVVVEDIYEQRWVVNADDPEALVAAIRAICTPRRRTKADTEADTEATSKTAAQGKLFSD